MKNFFLSPEGVKTIEENQLKEWARQSYGGFMNTSGPVMLPLALEPSCGDAVQTILASKKNFVFWFTPDFRAVFVTKDGAVSSNGLWWKIRYEWRGVSVTGKPLPSVARFDRRIKTEEVIPALSSSFKELGEAIGKAQGVSAQA